MVWTSGNVKCGYHNWVFCSSMLADAFQSHVVHQGGFPQSTHAPLSTDVYTPSGDETEQIYKHACNWGSFLDSKCKPFNRSIRFNSLDLKHFTLPDPAVLDWNSLDGSLLASALLELTYEACHNAKQRLVPTHGAEDMNLWRSILHMHDDKELWIATGWDGHVVNSGSCEECLADDEYEKHVKALLNPECEQCRSSSLC